MFSHMKLAIFSIFCIAITATFARAAAVLPNNVDQLVPTLKTVTAISQDMRTTLSESFSVQKAPLIVAEVTNKLTNIDRRLIAEIQLMGASEPYGDAAALPAVTALDNFVKVHRSMLELLIGKHHQIAFAPGIATPVGASLRNHEGVFDNFANALIHFLPTREGVVTKDVQTLEVVISKAVEAYSN